MEKKKVIAVLKQLKEKKKKRNFEQSVDLIINLREMPKKNTINMWIDVPHKIKGKKIAGFLTNKSDVVDTITEKDFSKYKDKKKAKKLAKEYDFFIASSSLMQKIASNFGKYLGPRGKMPSPELGIVQEEKDDKIKNLVKRLEKIVRLRSEEPSLKFCIGKEKMGDDKIAENIISAYNQIVKELPSKENVKNVKIKFTMSKPLKIER